MSIQRVTPFTPRHLWLSSVIAWGLTVSSSCHISDSCTGYRLSVHLLTEHELLAMMFVFATTAGTVRNFRFFTVDLVYQVP